MKKITTKFLIGGLILVMGIILILPIQAGTTEEITPKPHLYYYDEEAGEYVPVYPPWYDPENPETYNPPDQCPWWDNDGDGEFDWMPHWGLRWGNPEEGPWANGPYRRGGYGKGGCYGKGSRGGGYRPS